MPDNYGEGQFETPQQRADTVRRCQKCGEPTGCMMPDGGECCAGHAVVDDWHKQRREIERLREVCLIAEDVVWYDWSNNDSDAVHTMEQLRLVLGSALKELMQ